MNYTKQLEKLIFENANLYNILIVTRQINLPNWYIGAGVIRNIVWDKLHGNATPTLPNDIDVAFFDPTDLSPERDKAATRQLQQAEPSLPWEATNQAAVHTWHEAYFGYPIEPLTSTQDGIACWPETATSIGVRLLPDNTLDIYAPCGLADLFALKLRRNPRKVTLEEFRRRYLDKKMAQKWPLVEFIDG